MVERREWGTHVTFEAARADIEHVVSIAKNLLDMPLQYLTETAAVTIVEAAEPVIETLREIDGFDMRGDVSERRDGLVATIADEAEMLTTHTATWMSYLAYQRGDMSTQLEELRETSRTADEMIERASREADRQLAEMSEILVAAREAAGQAGVGTFNEEFQSEANSLATSSTKWMWLTAAFAIATIGVAAFSHFSTGAPEGGWELAGMLLTKLSLVAVLVAATLWCGRMYRSVMHQKAINRHKALSLQTFQAFVKATDDPRTKDAVLMAATNSIFDNAPTGMIEQRASVKDPAVQFVEIGRTLGATAARQASSSGGGN